MSKYLKVMFGNISSADNSVHYKVDEINVSDKWNPSADNQKEMGGFNFSTEDKILRWLVRGDTLYDVEIPKDAEVINCPSESAPNGVFRSNKIILHNPRIITDDTAMNLYFKSNLPEKSYYKSLIGCAIRGYRNTCIKIIKDKVNQDNIDIVLSEVNDFVTPYKSSGTAENGVEVYDEVMQYLDEIKSDLLISRFIDKKPYIKDITKDKIINVTGESGSGKSYFSNKYLNDENYIVIDTDVIFSDSPTDNKEIMNLRKIFNNKPKDYLFTNFDEFYIKTLEYFNDTSKTVVIDSAQYRNIKDCSILKGKIIVMRTSIETCYERVLNRWKSNMKTYTKEEYKKYATRKSGMFKWYKGLNKFLSMQLESQVCLNGIKV